MASSAGALKRFPYIAVPAMIPAIAYGAVRLNVADAVIEFFTGPGRNSRILALCLLWYNWKSLPFSWTTRVWGAMINHLILRKPTTHTPDKLFHPVITESHVALLEVDYNIHKSNSTYFADLDVSRTQLVSHLMSSGIHALGNNAKTKLVMDPSNPSKPAKGKMGIMLGAVHCSFRREIKPYAKFEMWSRILAWDRKWMYILTHFVEKGAVKPPSWDSGNFGPTRKDDGTPQDFEKKIYATALSKYVFKVGRLTVHPAIVIGASGLLPERPGGWVATENGTAKSTEAAAAANGIIEEATDSNGWDWRRTEAELNRGLEFAEKFAAMDGMHDLFDGAKDGALARF